ncbi:MAG: ArsJ-associated glyceraldehyde-3-phosphate dehydrogenase [Nitrospiria bacterium]
MSIRIAINGFGRMGKLGLRAGFSNPDYEIVHINDPEGSAKAAAHLLKFDSVHGKWNKNISCSCDDYFEVEGKKISWSAFSSISEIPWPEIQADLVLDCSGKFKTKDALQTYFDSGIKKVVVSTPVKDDSILNIVMGINDHRYKPDEDHLVTAASCTTNALAPVVKTINESLGIKHGTVTTIHDVTNTQTIIDKFHKDLRRARSSSTSLIPTTSGSSKAIIKIFPELEGRLESMAIRVPMQNSSMIDCVFEVNRRTTNEEVNQILQKSAQGALAHIFGYETLPLVSVDYLHESKSSVVDALSTSVVNGTQVKIIAWYDNEWGYVSRMMELVSKIASSLNK